MAAELRLGVSFDLVYFRQQLGKLSQIAASEFAGKVKLNIDKRDFQRQFAGLTKELRINVNDSQIVGARENLGQLNRSLATLRRAVAAPIEIKIKYTEQGKPPAGFGGTASRAVTGRLGGAQAVQGLNRGQLQAVYGLFREADLAVGQLSKGLAKSTSDEIRDALVPAFSDSGEEAVNGLANGLKGGSSKVSKAAAKLGEDTLRSIKEVLGIASPSREFKKIGDDSGEGFEQGLKNGLSEATRMGVQEMRSLFRALQGEAQSGAARLQATMLAAMAGIVQLPGGRQQRGRLMQAGAGINAAMTGPALGNVQARRATARGGAASTPAFAAALPLMFGMNPRELTARLQGLYGQQYRAPNMGGRQAPRPGRIASLIASLASARGNLSPAAGVNQRLFAGGAVNPGLLSSGYIGRSAISPGFVNYPPGMPAAYGTGFTGGPSTAYGMAPGRMQGPTLPVRGVFSTASGSLGQFPSAGMMGPSSPLGSMGRFPSAGMMYPSSPLGVINAQSSMFGGGGGGGGGFRGGGAAGGAGGANGPGSHNIVQFGRSVQGVMGSLQTARVPLSGAIRELGAEFGTAVKQVLLFGTAYKALAFITSLPGQAFEAAKGLQTFRNQLDAVTSVTGTFEQSFQFIDTLAQRFNVPLESARQGFVKMYASMQPAGFNQQEIEGLFTGVSQAAAAFGMSSDQVDRVTNAFSQMASKGQIMSEELKGQLGDVLPGALSIFAEAAGMSIPEFSQAMEDGAFKGKAMQEVLNNVAIVFSNKFGPAAQNASKTLQGALNAINNNLLKMYESFGPLVDQMATVFGPQITKLIEDVTSVMKVLTGTFTDAAGGVDALSPRAQALYATIQQLIPTFKDAARAVVELGQFFVQLVPIAVQLGNVLLQIASSNIGKAFIAVSISVGILQTAFIGLTRVGIVPAIAAIYRLIGTQLSASLMTWHRQLITATQSMIGFTAAARASRIALIALRTALTGLVVGGILLGLEAIGTMLFDIGNKASKSAEKVRQLKIDLDRMAGVGDTLAIAAELETAKATEKAAMTRLNRAQTAAEMPAAQQAMLGPEAQLGIQRELKNAQDAYNRAQESRVAAQKALANAEKVRQSQLQEQKPLSPITPSPEGENGRAQKERESQVPQLKLRLELAKKLFDIDMQIASARLKDNAVQVSELELARRLTELDYERRQILLEDIPVEEQRLKIAELQFQRQQAIQDNQLKLQLDLNNEYIKTQEAITKIVLSQQEETEYVKEYYKLVLSGINPAIAKTRIEVSKRFAEEAKSLDTQMQQLEVGISTVETTIELLKAKQALSPVEKEQLEYSQQRLAHLKEQLRLRGLMKGELPAAAEQAAALTGQAEAPKPFGVIVSEGYSKAQSDLDDLINSANMLTTAANGIGDAFGKAFTDIATSAQTWKEGLSSAFQSVASMFADMVAQMLAKWAAMQIISMFLPGAGSSAGATGQKLQWDPVAMDFNPIKNANGNVLAGGFQAFANGGVVTGPTLGLVGEGRFNEAVVPLPDGRKIPVDLGRGAGNNVSTNIVVNMNNGQSSSQMSGRGGQALGREIEGAVRSVIMKETRPGGLIYSGR